MDVPCTSIARRRKRNPPTTVIVSYHAGKKHGLQQNFTRTDVNVTESCKTRNNDFAYIVSKFPEICGNVLLPGFAGFNTLLQSTGIPNKILLVTYQLWIQVPLTCPPFTQYF